MSHLTDRCEESERILRLSPQLNILTMDELGYDILMLVTSFFFYSSIRISVETFKWIPEVVSITEKKDVKWRWHNVSISWVHSTVAGLGCLYCFIEDPRMAENLENGHTVFARLLVDASTGYFVYDAIDHLLFVSVAKSWEILLHHVVVITCFGLVVLSGLYVAFAVIALLVEVNSIFLHGRQLFRMSKIPQTGRFYLFLTITNVLTFILFRFVTLIWMLWWMKNNYTTVAQPYLSVLTLSIPAMVLLNVGLLKQVLSRDLPYWTNYFRKTFTN